jgi:hypothetical protein
VREREHYEYTVSTETRGKVRDNKMKILDMQKELKMRKSGKERKIKIEPVFLNVCGAPELIPRNEFRQHM